METGDEALFAAFLHYYEPTLNEIARGFVQEYAMQGHFADIKSACVYGLLLALPSYEKEKSPFVSYAKREIKRAAHEYIRTMRTGFTVPNDTADYLLRKTMRLYAEHDCRTDDATIDVIGAELHRKPKTVRSCSRRGCATCSSLTFTAAMPTRRARKALRT